jgi:hypothetical protein
MEFCIGSLLTLVSDSYDFTASGQGLYTFKGADQFLFIDPATSAPTTLTAEAGQPHIMTLSADLTSSRPTQTKRESYSGTYSLQRADI